MLRELKFKRDFGQTMDRFAAWWKREVLDRPPVTLTIAEPTGASPPISSRSLRERWMDVQSVVENAVSRLERGTFAADALPVFRPNLGPDLTATLFGGELSFGESTSWIRPIVQEPEEWSRIATLSPDFANGYWQSIEKMTDYALEICDSRFVVAPANLLGNYDVLAALRDPQMLCMDLLDCPNQVRQVARNVAVGHVEAFNRLYLKVARAGFGTADWTGAYHQGPASAVACDFWALLSTPMARDLVLPAVEIEMAPLERTIFHLDGIAALKQLDLVLQLPRLHAVQWAYGAGKGPAVRWRDVYRRILHAGKGVQILAETPRDALDILRDLGPRGVWLDVAAPFASQVDVDQFLKDVERACLGHRK